MLTALLVLSAGAILAGYVGVHATRRGFHHFLAPVFADSFAARSPHALAHGSATIWSAYGLMIVSGGLSIAAIFAAYVCYVRQPWLSGLCRATLPRLYTCLWNKWYVDELYDLAIVRPARSFGRLCVAVDDYFVDGVLWLITAIPRGLAYVLRGLQSGVMQAYALTMVGGIAVILILVS
jgi:NADH-quinone oxidoreductase subunit L